MEQLASISTARWHVSRSGTCSSRTARRCSRHCRKGVATGSPAARSFLDGASAEFCSGAGVLKAFEAFYQRARRSIPVLLQHAGTPPAALPRLRRSRTPCSARSTYCGAGVQRAADRCGLLHNWQAGAKPFTAEAIADASVRAPSRGLPGEPGAAVLGSLWAYCPDSSRPGLWAMDSVHWAR